MTRPQVDTTRRRAFLAFALLAACANAQTPPPVAPLPDDAFADRTREKFDDQVSESLGN